MTDHFADVVPKAPGQHGVARVLAAGHGVLLRPPQGTAGLEGGRGEEWEEGRKGREGVRGGDTV